MSAKAEKTGVKHQKHFICQTTYSTLLTLSFFFNLPIILTEF